MQQTLSGLLEPFNSAAIVGMCKNAGKTTVLNQIIKELDNQNILLGLTSVGRDGEASDLVTGTKKPGIYIRENTLLATAQQLLRLCDITREIIDTTGISTPLGEVVVLRARSDGHVQLAGPSITTQLSAISEAFFSLGADKVIIDGAISRKTLSSRAVSKATILCTGASYNRDIETVVADTAFICNMLTLPELESQAVKTAIEDLQCRAALLNDKGEHLLLGDLGTWETEINAKNLTQPSYIYIDGALSDSLIKPLLMGNCNLKEKVFVVRDASKILLKPNVHEKLTIKGARIQVLEQINLLAVTINPFSAYGFHFDKDEFMEKMQAAIRLPIFNVAKEQGLSWN